MLTWSLIIKLRTKTVHWVLVDRLTTITKCIMDIYFDIKVIVTGNKTTSIKWSDMIYQYLSIVDKLVSIGAVLKPITISCSSSERSRQCTLCLRNVVLETVRTVLWTVLSLSRLSCVLHQSKEKGDSNNIVCHLALLVIIWWYFL